MTILTEKAPLSRERGLLNPVSPRGFRLLLARLRYRRLLLRENEQILLRLTLLHRLQCAGELRVVGKAAAPRRGIAKRQTRNGLSEQPVDLRACLIVQRTINRNALCLQAAIELVAPGRGHRESGAHGSLQLDRVVHERSSHIGRLWSEGVEQLLLRGRQRVRTHDDVRRNRAAAVNRASRDGLEGGT